MSKRDVYLRGPQKKPEESTGSRRRGVEEPKTKAVLGEGRAARARSSRSVRSRSRCSSDSRRDTDASHIALLRSSTYTHNRQTYFLLKSNQTHFSNTIIDVLGRKRRHKQQGCELVHN